jgi:competence protein ComEA
MKPFSMILKSLMLSLMLAGVAVAGETVDINTADAATLDRVLDNVGAVKAEAIVAYREANGPFKSPEQLALVTGIGLKTVERNLDRITVGPAGASTAATPAKASQR